jgi:proline iminopeptidase
VTRTLVTRGLAVYTMGSGHPLLLMPYPHAVNVVGDPTVDQLTEQLANLGREVVTFDPPGSGQSTRPMNLGMTELVRCAEEALATVGVRGRVEVFGHSQGGVAALAFALQRPSRVRSLVLCGTAASGQSYINAPGAIWNHSHPDYWRMGVWGLLYRLTGRRAPALHMLNVITQASWVNQAFFNKRSVELRDWLRPAPRRLAWGLLARRLDYRSRLYGLRVPTLVLVGLQDPQMPLACAEELAHGIPGAHLRVFAHSGHYPFVEERIAFWDVMARFLGRAAARRHEGTSAAGGCGQWRTAASNEAVFRNRTDRPWH